MRYVELNLIKNFHENSFIPRMSFYSCLHFMFCLLDLWHSDNEQARSVIGTAAVCPVEMHTSRLENASLCTTCVWHCIGYLWSCLQAHPYKYTSIRPACLMIINWLTGRWNPPNIMVHIGLNMRHEDKVKNLRYINIVLCACVRVCGCVLVLVLMCLCGSFIISAYSLCWIGVGEAKHTSAIVYLNR